MYGSQTIRDKLGGQKGKSPDQQLRPQNVFLSLLIPAFSLLKNPQLLPVLLRLFKNAPLPIEIHQFQSFGSVFQPRTFSAQDLSTSELLRTL